jgi:hypothetical protein
MIESWKTFGDNEFGEFIEYDYATDTGSSVAVVPGEAFEMFFGMASNKISEKEMEDDDDWVAQKNADERYGPVEEDEDPAQGDMELDNGYTGSHEVALDKTNDNPSGDDKDEFTMDEPKGYRAVKMENCEETKAIHENLVSKYAEFIKESEEVEEGRGGAMARAGQKMKMDKDKGRSLDHSSEEFKALAAMYQKKAQERDADKAQVFGEAGEVHGATYTADQQEMLSYLANFIGEMFGTGEETDDIALHVLDELPYETLEDMEEADYDGTLADEVQYHVEAYQSGPDPEDVAYQADQQAWDDSAEMDELRGLAGI